MDITNKIKKIKDVIKKIMHPEIDYSLVKLGMIKDVKAKGDDVSIKLLLPFLNVPIREDIINSIKETITKLDKNTKIKINVEEMNQKERESFMRMAREAWIG